MDYTELVKALRECASDDPDCIYNCPYYNHDVCADNLKSDAAAAIEALQVELAISKGAIRILNYNLEQMKEDRMKQIEKEMIRLKREVQDESISKFIDGEW